MLSLDDSTAASEERRLICVQSRVCLRGSQAAGWQMAAPRFRVWASRAGAKWIGYARRPHSTRQARPAMLSLDDSTAASEERRLICVQSRVCLRALRRPAGRWQLRGSGSGLHGLAPNGIGYARRPHSTRQARPAMLSLDDSTAASEERRLICVQSRVCLKALRRPAGRWQLRGSGSGLHGLAPNG